MTLDEARLIVQIVIQYQDDSGGFLPQNGILLALWRDFPDHDWPGLVMEVDAEWGSQHRWYNREHLDLAFSTIDEDWQHETRCQTNMKDS